MPERPAKQRLVTLGASSRISKNWPPTYDATVLMPMRASTLRRPASRAAMQVAGGVRRANVLGAARARELGGELDGQPRHDGAGARRERHGRGVDVQDVARLDQDVGPAAQAGLGERHVHRAGGEHGRDGSR